MNKNPFASTAAYNPQQPPLPPGPPPPHPGQPDYSTYWAATAAAQNVQASAVGTYNPQWPTAQQAQQAAPRPPPEQSALYANYGYGGQQNLAWQQQRQAQPHYPPPPPVVQPPPPPPPPQPAYNPYQPQAGAFQQPYIPQGAPQPVAAPYQAQAAPQVFQQAPPPFFPQQQQQRQQQQQQQQRHSILNQHIHHASPQRLPPAKRQRFDGPNQHQVPMMQPSFAAPPPPVQQSTGMGMYGQGQHSFSSNRGGPPNVPYGGNRGGFSGGRGGNNSGGRGRGTMPGMTRGGNRGRGSGGSYNNMGGRGGGSSQGGSFRGHGSGRGFGSRDNNRRGGSFGGGQGGFSHSGGGGYHQQPQHHFQHQQSYSNPSSVRGRNQGFSHSKGGRHESGGVHSAREGSNAASASFSSGKKDENRRTLTDFKILGLEIKDLHWSWGFVPHNVSSVKVEHIEHASVSETPADAPIAGEEDSAGSSVVKAEAAAVEADTAQSHSAAADAPASSTDAFDMKEESASTPPPPSRIRIYFHTPVSADDLQPLTSQSSFSDDGPSALSNIRKGKRKKLEDDDGDLEDGRGPPPPPPHLSGMRSDQDTASVAASADYEGPEHAAGRDSVAPSVTETVSEGDWLMAAIGEEEDADGEDVEEHLHGPEVETYDDLNVGHDGQHEYGHDYDYMRGDGLIDVDADADADADAEGDIDADGDPDDSVQNAEHDHMPSRGPNGIPDEASGVTPHLQEVNLAAATDEPAAAHDVGADNVDVNALPSGPSSSHVPDFVTPFGDSSSSAAADTLHNPDSQVPTQTTRSGAMPLQAHDSIASTVPDTDARNGPFSPYASTENADARIEQQTEAAVVHEETQLEEVAQQDEDAHHDDEPTQLEATADESSYMHDEHRQTETPVSQFSTTLASGSVNGSTVYNDPSSSHSKPDSKSGKTASANRLSISYAGGTRRMVIDAKVVEKVKVFRAEGRIEVLFDIVPEGENSWQGIVFEGYSDSTYLPLDMSGGPESDSTIPWFLSNPSLHQTTLVAYLDKDRPLSEPRWVKTGDVQEWLKSMFGRMFWVAGEAADGWEKKLEVIDPDPAPTIWTILEAWASNSNPGTPTERQRFLRTHMAETDNILEILLRLVRGERSSYSQSSAISPPSISGPLLSALSQGSAHGSQQTHVSLAVLAIFRLAVEYAKKVAGDAGKSEAEERVGDIIRSLPSHLIYKSLDGIFKEWKMEKKGGR